MSKRAQDGSARTKEAKSSAPVPVFLPPLKPRPGLFYVMLVATALWIIALLVLYFTTVYPQKPNETHSVSHQRVA